MMRHHVEGVREAWRRRDEEPPPSGLPSVLESLQRMERQYSPTLVHNYLDLYKGSTELNLWLLAHQ